MKGCIKQLVGIIVTCFVLLVLFPDRVQGTEFKKGVSTAYCLNGVTASGGITQEGICAGAREYLGKTVVIYQRLPDNSVGRHLGTFKCMDTGKTDALKKGLCIDVWRPNRAMCQQWMDLVYMDGCKGRIYFKILEE